MSDKEMKSKLDESIQYFDDFVNKVLMQGVEGVVPMEVMTHYNILRNELSKLYVDIE